MSMMIKYRIHEVAKDLGIQSKEIIALLNKYFEDGQAARNHMTSLTEKELDLIFNHYTQQNQVESLSDFFAMAKKAEKAPDAPTAAVHGNKQGTARPEQSKPSETQTNKAPEVKIKTLQNTNNNQRPLQSRQTPDAQRPQQSQPFQPQRPKGASTPKNRAADRTTRVVDTRGGATVDLSKYDERFTELVPDRVREEFNSKQKIKRGPKKELTKKEELERQRQIGIAKQKAAQVQLALPEEISVSELAQKLRSTNTEVVKKLMVLGIMASASQVIDFDTASLVAEEMGAKVEREVVVTIEDKLLDDSEDKSEDLLPRSPVVVVMGHVDHGKTSLLDKIRNENVVEGEAGGITQHIGAYAIEIKNRKITFLDTPGHEAFTAMRARGAQVTDIAILVVAADDGIMPQTVEAINHAKAAGVSIIVAINKIDKEGANPDRIKQELTEYELVPEEWGGDTICVNVSAKTGENIDQLLEFVLLVADMRELKANPNRTAKGAIIEAKLDKSRGPVATVLVQNGTLHRGDSIIAGMTVGRIRTMYDDRGNRIEEAGPSVPVEIVGLSEVPGAGDTFYVVSDERMAKALVDQRKQQAKEEGYRINQRVSLDDLFEQINEGMKELFIIVKADTQGSVEAIKTSIEKLSDEEVKVKVIHGGVGAITNSDSMLAATSGAIIVGFNVRPDVAARESYERGDVDIRLYRVIYDCIDEIKTAMKGLLDPKIREVLLGHVEVREVFKISSIGVVCGSYVLDGKVARNALIRVVRDGIVIAEDKVASLKRFKDDEREVMQGYECGISLEKYKDIKQGDILESFILEEYRQ